MTTVEEDRTRARVHGLLAKLRHAETDYRRSHARFHEVITELDQERVAAGLGATAGLLADALNLSKTEAKTRVEPAGLLTPRRIAGAFRRGGQKRITDIAVPNEGGRWQSIGKYFGQERLRSRLRMVFE
ncbi:MAG: DUF222 domain-containing protein [Pseudonocardiaceae bacterium]